MCTRHPDLVFRDFHAIPILEEFFIYLLPSFLFAIPNLLITLVQVMPRAAKKYYIAGSLDCSCIYVHVVYVEKCTSTRAGGLLVQCTLT